MFEMDLNVYKCKGITYKFHPAIQQGLRISFASSSCMVTDRGSQLPLRNS